MTNLSATLLLQQVIPVEITDLRLAAGILLLHDLCIGLIVIHDEARFAAIFLQVNAVAVDIIRVDQRISDGTRFRLLHLNQLIQYVVLIVSDFIIYR